jgi:hypothetical protein
MNIRLCCHLFSSILKKEILLSVRWSLCVNFVFRPLFLSTDVVLPWYVYADITLETVARDTTNIVAVLNAHKRSVLFQNWTSLTSSDYLTRTAT